MSTLEFNESKANSEEIEFHSLGRIWFQDIWDNKIHGIILILLYGNISPLNHWQYFIYYERDNG